jgi:hypothetical protein
MAFCRHRFGSRCLMDGVSIFNVKFEPGPDSPDGIGLRHIGWAASFHLLLFILKLVRTKMSSV